MISWLDGIFTRIFSRGSELEIGAGTDYLAPLSAAMNPTTKRIEVTSSAGGSGHTIENNGSALVQRTSLNFVGFTTADVAGKSTVTLPAINLATGVTGQLATANHADDSVTYGKMQPCSAASRVLGRGSAAGAGDLQELTCSGGVEVSGTTVQRSALTGAVSAAAGSNTTAFASGAFGALPVSSTSAFSFGSAPASVGAYRMGNNDFVTAKTSLGVDVVVGGITSGDTMSFGDAGVPATMLGATSVTLRVGANNILQAFAASVRLLTPSLNFDSSQVAPTITQSADASATVTGDNLTVAAQSVSGTTAVTAGTLLLAGGSCTGGSGTRNGGGVAILYGTGATSDGNISLGATPASFQSMQRGYFIANCSVLPTGNPVGGGFLFVDAGALKYRGSSGTVTTLGPA